MMDKTLSSVFLKVTYVLCLFPSPCLQELVTSIGRRPPTSVRGGCTSSEFQCVSGQCIPWEKVCDRRRDCPDHSDEELLCSSKVNLVTPVGEIVAAVRSGCSPNQFQCTAGQCVPADYVCDGEGDCPDSSDEQHCSDSGCSGNHFRCSNGRCIPYLYRCDDDDDCGDRSDEQCDTFLDNFLVVVETRTRQGLYQIQLESGDMVPLNVSSSRMNGLAFDDRTKTLYWTDIDRQQIRRYSLVANSRTRNVETIFNASSSGILEGLALDLENEKLYYCRADTTNRSRGVIGEMSLNGDHHRIVLSEPGQPRTIVLDTDNRLMYWTDWGATPAIVRARMDDGGDRTVLVSTNITWPNALAIDFEEEVIYWGDAWHHRIERIHLSGTRERRVVIDESTSNASYFSFALGHQFLYTTDRSRKSVRKLDLRSGKMHDQRPIGVFDRLNGIVFYNSSDRSASARRSSTVARNPSWASTSKVEASKTSKPPQQPVGTRKQRPTTRSTTVSASRPTDWQSRTTGGPSETHIQAQVMPESDSSLVTIIIVVVVGVVVVAIVIAIGIIIVKTKRTRNRRLYEKRLVVSSTERGLNSYNYSPFAVGVREEGRGSTSSCSDEGDSSPSASRPSPPLPRGTAFASNGSEPVCTEDDLALNNIYSTVVGDYENLNMYEVIDDSPL